MATAEELNGLISLCSRRPTIDEEFRATLGSLLHTRNPRRGCLVVQASGRDAGPLQ